MLKHKHIDKICCAVIALTVLVTALFMGVSSLGIVGGGRTLGYEARLFDTTRVHTIDIVMDDWDGFLETCENEEYSACSVVVDGEAYKNVGIRAKGNTSLSSVAAYGNNRYSFKIEFDKYTAGGSYYGLDKLSLNNIIQDNTYLKDYLSFAMMRAAGVASPLCSFAYIRVNGEDWGLYLAIEGVEQGFLQRNYGADYGNLYKPDSTGMGGGRGNGKEFDMEKFMGENQDDGAQQMAPPQGGGFDPSASEGAQPPADAKNGDRTPPADGIQPTQRTSPENGQQAGGDDTSAQTAPALPGMGGGDDRGGGRGGIGSSDVMLQYIDDDPDSYQNIFDNAKTEITTADKTRLIASLKTLSESDDPASVVDVDAVIKYFVAHTFVRNDDSYTGSIIHNYYLYEKDGVLSMIPWDYNLAFGGFGMGGGRGGQSSGSSGATSDVNYPIDSPVSGGDISSRPMIAWIFESEEYTELYHQYYREFIDSYFGSGEFEEEFDRVVELISPYVEKDPTAFCTYEEFQTGIQTLREFCLLRAQSVSGQLSGAIPSTSEGQSADSSALVDASHLSLSDMGNMGAGGGRMGGGAFGRTALRANAAASQPEAGEAGAGTDTQPQQQPDTNTAPQNGGASAGNPGQGARAGSERTDGAPPDASGAAGGRGSMGAPGSTDAQDGVNATPPPSDEAADAGTADQPRSGGDTDTNQSGSTNPSDRAAGGGRQANIPAMADGGQTPGAQSGTSATGTLLWLGASVLALAAGILIAWKVKH